MATLQQAIDQMVAAGMPAFPPGHPRVNTDRIVRYGPKKRGFYRLFEYRARNGQFLISGFYGLFGAFDATKIETNYAGIDAEERERLARSQRELEQRERDKRTQRAQFAANRARMQYDAAQQLGSSEYLKRKQVKPTKALRFQPDGTLLVPMADYAGDEPVIKGLQKIAPDGSKRFNAGMDKVGTACRLGAKPKDGEPILIAEGVATGLSLVLAKKRPLFVAFDCGNLGPVAKMLRAKYPNSHLLFCADDDYRTVCQAHQEQGVDALVANCGCNPGRRYAAAAAAAVGNASVVAPRFAQRGDEPWTDFNDLHVAEGLERVGEQIEQAIAEAGAKPPSKAKPPSIDSKGFKALLGRYVLIYGTETVWDRKVKRIIRLSAVRAAFGRPLVAAWQGSKERQMVDETSVVFDPAGELDPPGGVNLFYGMPIAAAPSADGCSRLLERLHFLCNEDEAVFDWVLRWMAYPLQHPGAKMQTAIVMHGKDGAGKNQFWSALRHIYGPYAAIIGQSELESDFNDWASQRLFIIANEVLSRQELRHHVGKLKNLITEPELQINAKMLPRRLEANHLNIVFFSNELQPVWIDDNDRRYLIIETPPPEALTTYVEVARELDAGGAAALYRYLLDYDLGDFNEHTKPIMTAAKRELIDMGMNSAQLFWRELHDELLPLPYAPCLAEDLTRAYTTWCARNNIKAPMPSNQFSRNFRAMNGVRRGVERVALPGKFDMTRIQRTVFRMGGKPQDQSESQWVDGGISAFNEALGTYLHGSARANKADDA